MDKVLWWFLVSVVSFASAVTMLVAWWQARERAMRAESMVNQLLAERGHPAARHDAYGASHREMHPSTTALDAIAAEVERIGEAQRFLTQAMLERARNDDIARRLDSSRAATPH